MTAQQDPPTPRCSPLQLAWLHELGIEKPWLPAGVSGAQSQGQGPVPAPAEIKTAPPHQHQHQPQHQPQPPSQHTSYTPPQPDLKVQVHEQSPAPGPARQPTSSSAASVPRVSRAPAADAGPAITAELPTRAIAAAATDLDALGAAIRDCEGCGLCKSRHQVVVGEGVDSPAIMVIGEAPGEQEDRQGLPFVGRSGMLLDNMLATIGASRHTNVYVANAIKCRPPGNRNPRPEESAACHPFLMRQIALVNPRTILVLGRVAAQAVLSTDSSLQALRGRPLSFDAAGGQIPMVVSYHPAYLLRRPTEKAAAWEDLQRLRAIAAIEA